MPAAAPDTRISIAMAMDTLEEAAEDVRTAKAAYEAALERRDKIIREMRAERIPFSRLAQRTRLSRDSLNRIVSSGHNGVSQA